MAKIGSSIEGVIGKLANFKLVNIPIGQALIGFATLQLVDGITNAYKDKVAGYEYAIPGGAAALLGFVPQAKGLLGKSLVEVLSMFLTMKAIETSPVGPQIQDVIAKIPFPGSNMVQMGLPFTGSTDFGGMLPGGFGDAPVLGDDDLITQQLSQRSA